MKRARDDSVHLKSKQCGGREDVSQAHVLANLVEWGITGSKHKDM